uniref:ribonuclease H n=1 Tax=Sphaeramia orbicularis TaxID=375764 RepID=A0A673BIY0_9TELE
MEHGYQVGDEIYSNVDGVPYLVDTGAQVLMTRRNLTPKGHLKVQLADGTITSIPYGIWKGIVWALGKYDLLSLHDMKLLYDKTFQPEKIQCRLQILSAKLIQLHRGISEPATRTWYKPVNIPEVTEQKVAESDFSETGKARLRDIIDSAKVARFKNYCGDLGEKYVHVIEGGVHPPVRQYPLNPEALKEMDLIVKELSFLGVIREEPNPITNSPIQAVKKPESAGGGWRPVINFKALNRRTVANRASLINPQGTLKTLKLKPFKSCIDLANGFFSLRLAKASQVKTAFTHKGRAYVWTRLPQGFKNSPNVFQSAVMDILEGLDATVYIDDVFIADDTEEEHLERLQRVVEKLQAAGLKLNLKKFGLGRMPMGRIGVRRPVSWRRP